MMRKSVSAWPLGHLLLVDGVLIASYVFLWLTGWLENIPSLDLGWGGSIQEYSTYLKWLVCSLMGLWLFGRSRELLYLSWAALFLCFFVEDAASLRDQAGAGIASVLGWGPTAGLTGQGLGEFASAVVGGIVLLGAVAFVHSSSDHREAKALSRDLAPLLGGLIIFGIGVDTIHAMAGHLPTLDFALGVMEEGGEIIIASMLTAAFYMHAFRARSDAANLPTAVHDAYLEVTNCGVVSVASGGGAADLRTCVR